ncbi:MAG: amidohydrolase family protein [Gammaproteobacteria bacterium]|nr:amidohydrolase family protein [Gammaproteobacteria bacterium]
MDRRTRSGFVLGADERIDFDSALYSITQGAAYAYLEEDLKGSISIGKQADLVILGADPRTIPVSEIKIIETIARGKTVYGGAESAR